MAIFHTDLRGNANMRSWLIVLLVSLVHRDQATETKNQYGTGHLALSGMLHQGNFLMENFEQLRSLPLDLDINKFFTGLTRLNTIFALTNFVILRIKERNTFSLKKAFERLDARMVHIEESLQQELDLISHQTMKTRFFQYELVIRHSLRHCRAYLSTSTDRTREEFINVAKTLKDSMFAIFDGLLNGLAFGSDILALTRDAHHVIAMLLIVCLVKASVASYISFYCNFDPYVQIFILAYADFYLCTIHLGFLSKLLKSVMRLFLESEPSTQV